MKTTAVLLATLALALAVPVEHKPFEVEDVELDETLTSHPFHPRIDHFRPQDGRVANFTYIANLEFYQPNGPIFVYINDGGIYHTEWLRGGLVYDVARAQGGALITADHRYTGVNIPVESATFENLAHLTIDQALGDIAILINTVKADLSNTEGAVILWGTGYGATLSTFARKKYPHLVDAVFASSAWFRAEAIDNNYYDALSMIVRQHGSHECGDRVDYAFAVLENLIENSESEYLQERLGLCQPLNVENEQEVALVVYRFIDIIATYIRYNHHNGLQNFCRAMDAVASDPFNSLLRWIEYAYGGGNAECVNANYETIIGGLAHTEWSELTHRSAVSRTNLYLSCTQLGGLKVTSDFVLDIFPSDLITPEYQYRFCEDVFGPEYNRSALAGAVDTLNFMHGGQDQIISHIVFSNAALDPLLSHGIAQYEQFESAVVFLQHSAPGADLRSISGGDAAELTAAKTTITEFLTRWSTPTPIPTPDTTTTQEPNPTPTPLTF